jgi:hypothetical protein
MQRKGIIASWEFVAGAVTTLAVLSLIIALLAA